ncbi:hypothetical protein DHEL01_v213081 [Diaporthe helianthi]|uniref:Uncharacterized protein n=1 Tax=Diaporthe helianthi TaxID=158607 RepID=A0A2P5HE36_DIAHE|nr:hypothetical protein DHEL01_v213081 [Diaporthe helianthi]
MAERRNGGGGSSNANNSRARSRSPVAGPSRDRADLAQQRRDIERRETELERRHREILLQQQEMENELLRQRLRQQQLLAEQERQLVAELQAQRAASGSPGLDEAQALLALPVAQRRAALLSAFGVTGGRPRAKGKSKGAGWHKRGYRDANGDMWINVKIGEECTRGQDVWEGETLVGFVQQVQFSQEGSDYGYQAEHGRGNMTWDLLFRKKSLRQLLTSLEEAGLGDEDVLVRDLFDGGETVYYRLYDAEGNYVKRLW